MRDFDAFIINGKKVFCGSDVKDEEIQVSFGEKTNLYNLQLEIIDGSPNDLKLKEIFANQNKYKISINIELEEKEDKNNV